MIPPDVTDGDLRQAPGPRGGAWLATGLTGELGSQLQHLLAAQARPPLVPFEASRPHVNADTVVHMAARARGHSAFALWRSNISYLAHVLRHAERSNVRRFVFISTASVYGAADRTVLREDDAAIPWGDVYAWTKRAGERLVARSRIPVRIIIRLPALLEMRKATNFISRSYSLLRQGTVPPLWNLDQPFNGLIAAAEVLRFLSVAESSGTVNLAPEPTHTLREHVEEMSRHLARPVSLVEKSPARRASILCTQRLRQGYGFQVQDSLDMLSEWMIRRDAG